MNILQQLARTQKVRRELLVALFFQSMTKNQKLVAFATRWSHAAPMIANMVRV